MVRNQRDEGQSQYTQTYSTADRTVANATFSHSWNGATSPTAAEGNAILADIDDLRQTLTAIIDDLQEAGVIN